MRQTCMAARTVMVVVRMEAQKHGREGRRECVRSVARYPPSSPRIKSGSGLVCILRCGLTNAPARETRDVKHFQRAELFTDGSEHSRRTRNNALGNIVAIVNDKQRPCPYPVDTA